MISLSAKIRQDIGRKVKFLRKKGILPGVLYGPEIKNLLLEFNLKEFEKVYKEVGESSLISFEVAKNKFLVLIHKIARDSLTGELIHADLYQPKLKEEIVVSVPLIFEGESPAVKQLSGTLIKNIHEVEIKALPQNLPHDIKVNIETLETFEDNILIKHLKTPKDVEILKEPEEVVASVSPPEKVEEELEKPLEERVEEVEKVEEKKGKEEKEETEKEKGEKEKD